MAARLYAITVHASGRGNSEATPASSHFAALVVNKQEVEGVDVTW
jgi:hypothetical protein